MKVESQGRTIAVSGHVMPSDWDRRGEVVMAALITEGFERYIVGDTAKGRELLKLIDMRVEVRGELRGDDASGNKIVNVAKYAVIEDPES